MPNPLKPLVNRLITLSMTFLSFAEDGIHTDVAYININNRYALKASHGIIDGLRLNARAIQPAALDVLFATSLICILLL